SGGTFPLTLGRGQSVTLNVTFAPRSVGTTGGSLYIPGPALAIPLIATGKAGAAAGQLTVTPAALNFGSVPDGTTATQSISLSATGSSVTISSSASSSSQFVLDGTTLPLTVIPGQSVSLNVAFTPQSSGTVSGSLSFASNASNSGTPESLTGVGTATQYSVNLSWNPSSDVMGYNVYRSTAANGKYSKINSSVNPNTAYTDSTVVSGQTYYYAATSVNSSGQESSLSTPPVGAAVP
ncbi:MAG: choice-of-anchor D domain-containing protein, partial [Candidatus Sulfotelmatobacter sp.]